MVVRCSYQLSRWSSDIGADGRWHLSIDTVWFLGWISLRLGKVGIYLTLQHRYCHHLTETPFETNFTNYDYNEIYNLQIIPNFRNAKKNDLSQDGRKAWWGLYTLLSRSSQAAWLITSLRISKNRNCRPGTITAIRFFTLSSLKPVLF